MPPTPIDRTRPIHEVIHANGGRVLQYLDDPGRYFAADGTEMSAREASDLGMDVQKSQRDRKILDLRQQQMEEMSEFQAELEQKTLDELEELSDVDSQKVDPDSVSQYGPNKFNKDGQLRETSELKMVHVGGAKFNIFRKDETGKPSGDPLNEEKLPGAQAVKYILDWHADEDELSVA